MGPPDPCGPVMIVMHLSVAGALKQIRHCSVCVCVTVARTRRQNALDASTAPLYYYHDRVQHRYTRPPLRPSRPDLRPHRDSNQRPPTHGPPCRTHGQEFWTLTGLELATCGSVPKTNATSRPLHYCVANLAPNQDVTVARTRRQNALDASTAPLYYYHDRVQHRYTLPAKDLRCIRHIAVNVCQVDTSG